MQLRSSVTDLGEYGEAALQMESRIIRLQTELREYLITWMGEQDSLFEDLLQEMLAVKEASRKAAPPKSILKSESLLVESVESRCGGLCRRTGGAASVNDDAFNYDVCPAPGSSTPGKPALAAGPLSSSCGTGLLPCGEPGPQRTTSAKAVTFCIADEHRNQSSGSSRGGRSSMRTSMREADGVYERRPRVSSRGGRSSMSITEEEEEDDDFDYPLQAANAVERKRAQHITWDMSDQRSLHMAQEVNRLANVRNVAMEMDRMGSCRDLRDSTQQETLELARTLSTPSTTRRSRSNESFAKESVKSEEGMEGEDALVEEVHSRTFTDKATDFFRTLEKQVATQQKQMANSAHQVFFTSGQRRSTVLSKSNVSRTVNSHVFEKLIGFMIFMSSITVGVEVQISAVNMSDDLPVWLEVMQWFFVVFFFFELMIRMWVEGLGFYCKTDWQWNLFDTLIVLFSLVDKVSTFFTTEGHPVLVISRMIRLVRIVRIIRVVRFLRELKMMIMSIYYTLKSLVWSLVLMVLMMYLFAAYLTQATTLHLLHTPEAYSPATTQTLLKYWGSLPSTSYTLFLCMSGGISWGEPVESLWNLHWTTTAIFLVYISFTLFAFLNVITGFFCVSATDIATVDKEQIVQEQRRNKEKFESEFRSIFKMMDVNRDGDLTLQELEDNFEDPRLVDYFSHLNLDIHKAWDIFKLLDGDGNKTLSIEEFVGGCLKMRGSAKSIDVCGLSHDVQRLSNTLSKFMYFVQESFEDLTRTVRDSGSDTECLQRNEAFRSSVVSTQTMSAWDRANSFTLPGFRNSVRARPAERVSRCSDQSGFTVI